jgi:hypothetical protein
MESQERKYLIDHGFDVKSPFDAEAVEIIMKDYLEAQTKSQESDSLPCVRLSLDSVRQVREMKELSENSRFTGKRHKEAIKYGFVKGVDWAKEEIRKLNEA